MINLYKLEIFNTVAQEGSFSKAAGRLLLTRPAVSQHIRDLETSLGVDLFIRGNWGVGLTAAGDTLFEYSRAILKMLAEAETVVMQAGQ
jgi:DNA-binding transcriptional LysR family regulator